LVTINRITAYAMYLDMIDGCRDLARDLGCRLIEVEQFWQGADGPADDGAVDDLTAEDALSPSA
jgi:hypothetical protein